MRQHWIPFLRCESLNERANVFFSVVVAFGRCVSVRVRRPREGTTYRFDSRPLHRALLTSEERRKEEHAPSEAADFEADFEAAHHCHCHRIEVVARRFFLGTDERANERCARSVAQDTVLSLACRLVARSPKWVLASWMLRYCGL